MALKRQSGQTAGYGKLPETPSHVQEEQRRQQQQQSGFRTAALIKGCGMFEILYGTWVYKDSNNIATLRDPPILCAGGQVEPLELPYKYASYFADFMF
eukprot:1138270-Pelagomonas_calceolata.AAC.1